MLEALGGLPFCPGLGQPTVVCTQGGQVSTSGVQLVAQTQRAAELARMMAGLDTSESALAHAGELVELAEASRTAG